MKRSPKPEAPSTLKCLVDRLTEATRLSRRPSGYRDIDDALVLGLAVGVVF